MNHNISTEELRKMLEDAWEASRKWQQFIRHGSDTTNAPSSSNTYINSILAALDDGQEGKATMKELVRQIFGDEAAEDKDIVDFYQRVHKTAIEEMALPVADGEGEKVGSSLIDLVKNLNWVKNLLSSITAAVIAGRDLDFVKHGTPFFEEMLMAYKSAKAILMDYENIVKGAPSAVTGGVKWRDVLLKIKDKAADKGFNTDANKQADLYLFVVDIIRQLDEGQPEQGGKP